MVDEILFLYPAASFVPGGNVAVSLVNGVSQIVYWDSPALGPQPTPTALSAVSAQAAQSKAWDSHKTQALQALRNSDVTIIRCIETVPAAVPTAWDTYKQQLRAIVSATTGDPTQPLPTAPTGS